MPLTSQISPVFTAEQIAARVQELGAAIRREAGDTEVFLLAILKGAGTFLADLLRAIPGPVSYGYIDVVRDTADQQLTDAVEIDFLSFTDIRGRNVYVLKDVVASGVVESYLLTQLKTRSPAALRLVAVLDRGEARTIDLKVDYCAFTVEEGTWVGYGLEHDRRHGNLPFIGRIA